MSTKFYMFTQKKELKPFFGSRLRLVDEPHFGYKIYIARTSGGWQPLFQAHDQIQSVSDLKLLYDKGGVQIFDEYGKEFSWPEFVQRVVNWGNEHNWRTARNNDQPGAHSYNEFTSVDGYRFESCEFC